MGYFGDVWSNLVFNAGSATSQFVNSLNWRYQKKTGDLKYVSRSAYKSVLVHVTRQLLMQSLEVELNSLMPKYQRYVRDKMLDIRNEGLKVNKEKLIERQQSCDESFGKIWISDGAGNAGKQQLVAKTQYGRPVPEALMIWYDGNPEDKWSFTDVISSHSDLDWYNGNVGAREIRKKSALEELWNPGNELEPDTDCLNAETIDTCTFFHIDLAPSVSLSSSKNLVLTQVQGRDFTRKELVSGGDLTYNVSGNIVSNDMGVYPSEAVKRFVKIMQYAGIVNVNFFTFGLLGINRIIIKDFSLGQIEYKNIQPYSFTCVAVEPNDSIKIEADTIVSLNRQLEASNWESWYKSILDNKLAQMGVQKAADALTSSMTSLAAASLDNMVSNI